MDDFSGTHPYNQTRRHDKFKVRNAPIKLRLGVTDPNLSDTCWPAMPNLVAEKNRRRGKLKLASDPKSWEGKIGVLMHKPSSGAASGGVGSGACTTPPQRHHPRRYSTHKSVYCTKYVPYTEYQVILTAGHRKG